MADKPFNELSEEEATRIVEGIVRSSSSEETIRRRLNEAGFDGDGAAVSSIPSGHMAMVMTRGPRGEEIHV